MFATKLFFITVLCFLRYEQCYGELFQQEILERIITEFFRFKGVQSLVFVTCPEQMANGEVMVLTRNSGDMTWTFFDIYKVASNKPLKMSLLSKEINTAADLIRSLRQYGHIIPKRKNLEGISLKSGLVIAFPDLFTTIDDLRMRHIDTISKVSYPLITNLRHDMNFRLDLMQVDNYGWTINGTFDGFVGLMQRNHIDFGAHAIFMRLDRVAAIDFTAEAFKFRACLMFRQPPLSAVANIFALPFCTDVWWTIFIFFILTGLVMLTQIMHPFYTLNIDYLDCFIFAWGALCQQGFFTQITARSGRILIFTTFVTTLFLFTSFSANIVALLQSPSEVIATIKDLTQSPLDVGVQDTVYNKVFFKETTDPVTGSLYNKKIKPKGESVFLRPNTGIEKMRTSLFAYQVEAQTGYQIISDTFNEQEKCGLKELEPFQLPITALPVQKNFPYKELFRQRLRWQREVGLIHRENLRWLPQKPVCENKMAGFVSIGISECQYALLMFIIAICISLLILLLEVLYHKFQNEQKTTKFFWRSKITNVKPVNP